MASRKTAKATLPERAQDRPARRLSSDELGSTGLRIYAGRIDEEFRRELRGKRAFQVFREMRDNDPVVGAVLFAIEMFMRQVSWRVEPASQKTEDQEVAEFVEGAFGDMTESWPDTLSAILSFLPFGFSLHEEVYKLRNGPSRDPEADSMFDDGRIGWRKLPIRAQETIDRWDLGEHGELRAAEQFAAPSYRRVTIPFDRFLLFRTTTEKANPQGRSMLRNAWRPWVFKHRIEEIEGIGIERDLAGLPVAHVPVELLMADASPADRALADDLAKLVRNIRRDEKEGILFPRLVTKEGHELYKLELLTTGGRRQFDTTTIINRYDARIAMTALADFIVLGHEKVGSFALASSKTNLFALALGAWLDSVTDAFNRYGIPRLLELNTFTGSRPKLVHGDVETIDLQELGAFITALAGAGAPLFPNKELERWLLDQAGAPTIEAEASELEVPELEQDPDPELPPKPPEAPEEM